MNCKSAWWRVGMTVAKSFTMTKTNKTFIAAVSLLAVACGTTITDPTVSDCSSAEAAPSCWDPSCGDYADEAPTDAVTVTVRNTSSETIYLSGEDCTGDIALDVTDPDGDARTWRDDDGCTFTCAELQENDGVCPAICQQPPVVMIAPGGQYELSWSGVLFESTEMPAACFFGDGTDAMACHQQLVGAAGDYTLSTRAWSSVSGCGDPSECECTPDLDGACQLDPFGVVSGDAKTGSATVSYPSETAVEIIFAD